MTMPIYFDARKAERTEKPAMPGVLRTEDLPPYSLSGDTTVAVQMASYFKKLLAESADENGTLVVPPLQVLAHHFGVSEIEVFDAFYEMLQQGYEYTLHGIDSLVTLRDPLGKSKKITARPRWSPIRMIEEWLWEREEDTYRRPLRTPAYGGLEHKTAV